MNKVFVEGLTAPDVDKQLVKNQAKDIVYKTYDVDLLDYCFKCFYESFGTYVDDMDSNRYQFKITLADKRFLVRFDAECLYHLFGMSKSSLRMAVIINDVLKNRFGRCPENNGFKGIFEGIGMFSCLYDIFLENGEDIKLHDCAPENIDIEKLNWDKVAYKLYCFLNMGDLSCDDTIFYSNKDELLFERELISKTDGNSKVLVISFVPEKKGSLIYNPVSIRIVSRTRTNKYEFGLGSSQKVYTRVKGLKKGFATINKEEVD